MPVQFGDPLCFCAAFGLAWPILAWFLWVVGGLTLRQGTPLLTSIWYRIGLQPFINMRDVLLNL